MARVKYQVFVSSTFNDLREERDYYVLLLAGRYGSADAEGKSWTEREYDFARANGIPVLTFVREKQAISGDMVETGAGADRLKAFIDKVRATHLNASWTTAADLAGKVAAALNRAIEDAEDDGASRPGWVRGNTVPSNISEELARLSKENAELRALGLAGRPHLSLVREGEPVTDIGLFRPSYKADGLEDPLQGVSAWKQSLDIHNRSFWLALGVRNSGQAIARRVRAEFVIDGAEMVRFTRTIVRNPQSTHTDSSQPAYVSKESHEGSRSKGESIVIEQRFRDVGIDRTEDLLGMRLTAPRAALDAGELKFKVSYRVHRGRSQDRGCHRNQRSF